MYSIYRETEREKETERERRKENSITAVLLRESKQIKYVDFYFSMNTIS